MQLVLQRQPYVRHQTEALPKAQSRVEGLLATVAEGDSVEFWHTSTHSWIPGIVEEIPQHNDLAISQCAPGEVTVACDLGQVKLAATECPALLRKGFRISLIAPGGGADGNGPVYLELAQLPEFQVDVIGRKSTLYDQYPEGWPGGREPPNLASYGREVLDIGIPARTDCWVCGSRGGQVSLPAIWEGLGNNTPPAVVLNGGCAMNLPGSPTRWPREAVTIMLLGGQDWFRGSQSMGEYLGGTVRCVPSDNRTTALLYVPEMKHMPQPEVLKAALGPLILAALQWKHSPNKLPMKELSDAGGALLAIGFPSRLLFTGGPGQWQEMTFGQQPPDLPAKPLSPRNPRPPRAPPAVELGTAPAVFPIEMVMDLTPEKHRELADQALSEATAIASSFGAEPWAGTVRKRLLELAAGQEGDAYACEGDLEGKRIDELKKQQKEQQQQLQLQQQQQQARLSGTFSGQMGRQSSLHAGTPGTIANTAHPTVRVAPSPQGQQIHYRPTVPAAGGVARVVVRPSQHHEAAPTAGAPPYRSAAPVYSGQVPNLGQVGPGGASTGYGQLQGARPTQLSYQHHQLQPQHLQQQQQYSVHPQAAP
eukprot:CAMPEP_0206465006 /NCGR_PEP_ID=MMETSP0324_2-20121206/27563_1 /ASSEMBLY_ACC=CAM_ASM_000836 /TAXON_ID=2866 /ORGANISM="Crypthecodinium cohnii, Strain Seligo" /LENGTH=591 /DNA_ID=CAMNT_0053937763 /DNA_START=137 /DNA_END=1908 /DNA_ORIENTATION=+